MADVTPQTILQEAKAYADSLKSELTDALDRLESLISDRQTWVSFAPGTPFAPEKIDRVTADKLPELEKTIFGPEFGDPTADLERFKGHVFLAPLLNTMQTTLMGWVESGGVGITQAVQDALFGNMRERDLQALADGLAAVAATDAKRGFAYPTHRRRTTEVIVNYQQTQENRNREITTMLSDLAQKNVQQAIAANISIEQLHSSFTLGYAQVWKEIKSLIIDKFRIESEIRIAEYDAIIKAILAGYDLAKVNAGLDISYQELLMKTWEVGIREATERTKALIQEAEQQTMVKLQTAQSYLGGITATISSALLQTNGISYVGTSGAKA